MPSCRYAHDWRQSALDVHYYRCANCRRSYYSPSGGYPPNYTLPTTQGASTVANTHHAQTVLGGKPANGNGNGENEAEWYNVEDVLYQPIVITRASIADKWSDYQNKNRTYAYVNFYFFDDPEQKPFVFRTGWAGVRGKINQLLQLKTSGDDPFPVECGVVEILVKNPFVSEDGTARFPLDLVPFDQLEGRQQAEVDHNLKQSPATGPLPQEAPATTPPPPDTPPAAPATSTRAPGSVGVARNSSATRPAPRGR